MKLFEPITIGSVSIPNRVVKSAMAEGQADDQGRPSAALVKMYARWARGGVGLAITGMANVRPGYSFGKEISLCSDPLVDPLRALTDAAHEHGGRIFAQLCHAPPQIPRAKAKRLGSVGPSAGFCFTNWLFHRPISSTDLTRLTHEFGAAARRARQAGFDGIQLHAAHGYLLSRMLSPQLNRRRDRWGGSFDGRLRLLEEVYRRIREEVGLDYPVTIKLNAHDGTRRGLDLETSLRIARQLQSWGIDAIEVSAGIGDVGLGCYPNRGDVPIEEGKAFLHAELPFMRPLVPLLGPVIRLMTRSIRFEQEAYFRPLAEVFAQALQVPIICVGGIRSRAVAEDQLQDTPIAMVSLARPLVRQPALPKDWQRGRNLSAQCASCNQCFVRLGLGHPLRCWNKPKRP